MFEIGEENETTKHQQLETQLTIIIKEAVRFLTDGQLVVFPTDTVYGIGADCFNNQAIMKLYAAKGRSLIKGLPILLADHHDIGKVAAEMSSSSEHLIDRFWPGPLTLILKKRKDLPPSLSPNDGIAVRIPDNEIARAFIRASGGAVASSSANITGKAPARSADEIEEELAKYIAVTIEGGRVGLGRPSTVVDCRVDPPQIMRPGPISAEQIRGSSSNHP